MVLNEGGNQGILKKVVSQKWFYCITYTNMISQILLLSVWTASAHHHVISVVADPFQNEGSFDADPFAGDAFSSGGMQNSDPFGGGSTFDAFGSKKVRYWQNISQYYRDSFAPGESHEEQNSIWSSPSVTLVPICRLGYLFAHGLAMLSLISTFSLTSGAFTHVLWTWGVVETWVPPPQIVFWGSPLYDVTDAMTSQYWCWPVL